MNSSKFNELYKKFGYRKFKMSKFEPYDLYADYRDFLTNNQLITFTDFDGTLLALKPDITLSIIKNNTASEEKVYYNESIYRSKENHYREIPQVGVECVGHIDAYCEAEVVMLAAESMALISDQYVIRVSDVSLLRAYLSAMNLSERLTAEILSLFASRNSAELEELLSSGRITLTAAAQLRDLMDLYLPFEEGVKAIRRFATNDMLGNMIRHMEDVVNILREFEVLDKVFLDFSIVNSMDYYNGIVFQGAAAEIPFPVLYGGRYDPLPKKMGKDVEAVGFGVYLDEVDNYIGKPRRFDVDYLIVYDSKKEKDAGVRLARVMRKLEKAGFSVRSVRSDQLDNMQQRPRSRKIVNIEAAEKEVPGND